MAVGIEIIKLTVLCALLPLTEEKEIKWENELRKTFRRMDDGFKSGDIVDMLHDVLTPDFIRISPDFTIVGDFEEFAARLKKEVHKVRDTNIVLTCGNMAVTTETVVIDHEGEQIEIGRQVAEFLYVDGKAKARIIHTTI